ncbi:MAG: POT family MFS transporter [Phycisphaerales bacterium]|nr:POT family MFS transporter [Phycisphaerales bacterium]
MSKYLTAPIASKKLPGGIPYIIGNEAAERFSFYGMKGILTIFMTSYLFLMPGSPLDEPMSDTDATYWYHMFVSAVYITPLLGAFIADAFLGKYLTIMLLSIVYCLGHGALALMGTDLPFMETSLNPRTFLMLGLILICVGSGGIKPCVSAHVGDQFGESSAKIWLTKIFMVFYLSINIGAMLSNLATPWLLKWYGPHLAFGVPGVLMAVATLMFWMGRNKFIHVPPGGMAFIREVFSGKGIKALLKLSIIYLFVAVFWALFDQTGSTWILQAEDMDRKWMGITWLPSQLQFINPAMILILTPLFGWVVYPMMDKIWPLTPMRKISIGLFIMAVGFAIIAIAQQLIDAGETPSIAWQVIGYAIVTTAEVLVSITCLQFSYTQAPRKMKSIVMGFFLASVTVGNQITSIVTAVSVAPSGMAHVEAAHDKITGWMNEHDGERPDEVKAKELLAGIGMSDGLQPPIYSLTESGFMIGQPLGEGSVGSFTSGNLYYDLEGSRTDMTWPAMDELNVGADRIDAYWQENDTLPSNEKGAEILKDEKDSWGQPLVYRLINRNNFSVGSLGHAGDMLSASSITLNGSIIHPAAPDDADTWLSRRRAELDIETAATASGEIMLSRDHQIGGQNRFQGAEFFWFFTWLMLGTAIVFVPVAMLYRPHTYLMEEDESGAAA